MPSYLWELVTSIFFSPYLDHCKTIDRQRKKCDKAAKAVINDFLVFSQGFCTSMQNFAPGYAMIQMGTKNILVDQSQR